ncbi:hypothetical protein HK105_202417 [Polyrhizophydium stewartii]|uniref:Uncharacterized protein n=1 Tax=Polyrhizophydium stewartii TaxID=2732419 RepID=A0ABR4NER1_9FUNG
MQAPRAGVAPVAVRAFSSTAAAKADAVTELYLAQLRAYKPVVSTEKVDLPTSFSTPKAPAKPEVEGKDVAVAAVAADEALEEEEWPALYNAIDDPANYPDAWDYSLDNPSLIQSRTRPWDYHHHSGH